MKTAKRSSFGELLDECARTKAAAEPDGAARHRAIHASRFLRGRRGVDGAGEIHYRSTLEETAEVFAVVTGFAQRAFEAARAEGRREPEEAYLADGLLAAARAGAKAEGHSDKGRSGPPPRPAVPAKMVVRIDWDALVRGWPAEAEVCEIARLGPVAVSAVEAMMGSGNAFLAAVVTKGKDVVNVAHLGRRASAHQRTALEWLHPRCAAEGCNAAVRLETDHRLDWAASKITLLSLLDHLCGHHHDLKTYKGWALVAGSGRRPMVAPGDPLHPRHALHDREGPAPPEGEGKVA